MGFLAAIGAMDLTGCCRTVQENTLEIDVTEEFPEDEDTMCATDTWRAALNLGLCVEPAPPAFGREGERGSQCQACESLPRHSQLPRLHVNTKQPVRQTRILQSGKVALSLEPASP